MDVSIGTDERVSNNAVECRFIRIPFSATGGVDDKAVSRDFKTVYYTPKPQYLATNSDIY